jgi:hypothetical protein
VIAVTTCDMLRSGDRDLGQEITWALPEASRWKEIRGMTMHKDEFLRRLRAAQEQMNTGEERIMRVSDTGFGNLDDDVNNATTPAAKASAYSAQDAALVKGVTEFTAGYHQMRLALDEYVTLLDEWLSGDQSVDNRDTSDDTPASLQSLRRAHSVWEEKERNMENWALGLSEMSKQAAEGPPELNNARTAFQEAASQVQSDYNRAHEQLARATALLEGKPSA